MTERTIVARQSTDETTFAVVEFDGCEHNELLPRLQAALAQWAKTKEGRQACEEASDDFNVGDLSNHTPAGMGLRGSLGECLLDQGITYLDIDCYCDDQPALPWSYDSVLMRAAEE